MAYYIKEKEDYKVSTDPGELDLAVIHKYLSGESYWAEGIPLETVEKALSNSLCFGLYKSNKQIGFARLVTDKATFAYLADVFILEEHRGKGLSKWLMEVIQSHPELQGSMNSLAGRSWMKMRVCGVCKGILRKCIGK